MQKIKAYLIGLIALSISSCETLEIVHSDLHCSGHPDQFALFTIDDIDRICVDASACDSLGLEIISKIESIRVTYEKRIDLICSEIENSNTEHSK